MQTERHLLKREEVLGLLQLNVEQLRWLTNTGQLEPPIVLCGEERYDSNDINTLIEQYRQSRDRKNGNEQAFLGKEV